MLYKDDQILKDEFGIPEKADIAYAILDYLAAHPEAQDTFEGILQWWLLEQKIKYQKTMVKKTLEELVKAGFIIERRIENSLNSYRINQDKKEEIERFLMKCPG
jgi:Fe2+ or Zn2+ uptake regulation protein